jgi:hypothetical protein
VNNLSHLFLVIGLLFPVKAVAQTISIDSVPEYASLGFVSGSVTGVEFGSHRVATFIYIEGSGWWTKPTDLTPTVGISSSGGFAVNVGTGGPASLDSRAVIFCVALLPDSVTPDLALSDGRIPASLTPLAIDCHERYGRTFMFAGFLWAVKEAPLPIGPGNNVFSDRVEDVFVDGEGLHLRVSFHDGQWWSLEVILLSHLGYGTYAVQTDSEVDDLDVNLTFGMFTWDSYGDDKVVPGHANREIDFEDSRWTITGDPSNAQMVVQPYTLPGNLRRYTIPDLSTDPALTRFFTWLPSAIRFVALRGHHSPTHFPPTDVIDEYLYVHDPPTKHVPSTGREHFRLNLWLNNVVGGEGGQPQPANGLPVEVVITNVTYVPEPTLRPALMAAMFLLARLRRRGLSGSRYA